MGKRKGQAVSKSGLAPNDRDYLSPEQDQIGSYDPANEPAPVLTYLSLQHAYRFFDAYLFAGILPDCLITLQRHKGAYGYFSGNRFGRLGHPDEVKDEIALNPGYFESQGFVAVLSTLVHEMVHVWQNHFGQPGRCGYHNREWARKMNELGLPPSDTGKAGGKQTGDRMSHYIREGGPFDQACRRYQELYPTILYHDRSYTETAGDDTAVQVRLRKLSSKTAFDCPRCNNQRAWAKRSAKLMCLPCEEELRPVFRHFETDSNG